jgi:cleavage and polyadenylation specificity factor subunit 1
MCRYLRYEFATNEFVNSIACVPLETLSTESGHKEFIAVGTTINRGEDLAVKGAVRFPLFETSSSSHLWEQTYVFEIVEVVPDPASDIKRSFKLRLRCRDEAKGPVTAVCGIDGYLVSSMGQKVSDPFEPGIQSHKCRHRSLCVHLTSTSAWLAWHSSTLAST